MADIIDFQPKTKLAYGVNSSIGVVIQARMTSTRFPGKVMAMLAGKPVLQHVIERCKLIRGPIKIKKPIKVIVAAPDTPESEPILKLAQELGVQNFCGPENNVLERYYGAARFHKLDVIIRITSDCPLIDPKLCSEVLQLLMWRKVDYASNCHIDRTFPKGLDCEAFTYEALETTWAVLNHRSKAIEEHQKNELVNIHYDQEHVTPFMIREPEIKKAVVKKLSGDMSDVNLCVDFPSDIKRLENFIKKQSQVKIVLPEKKQLLIRSSVK